MTYLIRAELLKLLRRKTYLLMVLILAALVGMTAFFLIVFPRIAPGLAEGLEPVPRPEAFVLGAQQVVAQTWFPLILAVMMLGTEFSGTFWATTLTREARRIRHVTARLTVLTAAAWVATLAAVAGFAVVVLVGAVGEGTPPASTWLRIAGGSLLVELTWVAIGLGLVGVLRSIGPAIGVALAFSFGESLLGIWRPYGNVSLTANSTALLGQVDSGPFTQMIPGGGIPSGRAAWVVLVWGLAAVALAWWSLARRDP